MGIGLWQGYGRVWRGVRGLGVGGVSHAIEGRMQESTGGRECPCHMAVANDDVG